MEKEENVYKGEERRKKKRKEETGNNDAGRVRERRTWRRKMLKGAAGKYRREKERGEYDNEGSRKG